ncbi:MAG: PQQ-dependent sugar dehydrogenase [Desulfuromonadaceae bacterium]|nr:PQQ-dependent sugar dehydrogenase [Desulfuromonadaceae bacterium]
MRGLAEFFLYLFLLWGTIVLVFGVKSLSLDCPLLLFIAMLGVGVSLALIGKRWGRGMLLLAIPLSILLAYLSAERLWPPVGAEESWAQVYRLTPELHGYTPTTHSEQNTQDFADDAPLEALAFTTQTQTLPVPHPDTGATTEIEVRALAGVDLLPVACGLQGIGDMVFAADSNAGMVFASLPDAGLIYSLEQQHSLSENSNAAAASTNLWRKRILTPSIDRPMGLAWQAGYLYVATRTAVLKLGIPTTSATPTTVETIVDGLPPATATEHRALSLDAEGNIYLSIGAGDAQPQELEWQRAAVLLITKAGEVELYATGLHHARALGHHPQTGELWVVDSAPDTLELHPPADEINVLKRGEDYGWPFCYEYRVPDRHLGTKTICSATAVPRALLPPHSVPAGFAFGTNLNAPQRYRSMLYVALKGRVHDLQRRGFRIIGLPLDEKGNLSGWGVDVVSGLATAAKIYAQPAALVVAPDGYLYVADAHSGMVYRFLFPFDIDLKHNSPVQNPLAAMQGNRKG